MHRCFCCLFLSLFFVTGGLLAQSGALPSTPIQLTTLADFRPAGANWQLAADVFYDLNKPEKSKRQPGTGIVVNDPTGQATSPLVTNIDHGDLALELDFMLAKGTASGLCLLGRYTLCLTDSRGNARTGPTDCGAIAARRDNSRPNGPVDYEAHPPTQNVAKAPGLWQHLSVVFQAPRINAKGEKTANARFVRVVLNGVTVQENIELTGPTNRALFADEKPTGPLVVLGDGGALALRRIDYKTYGTEPVTLTNMSLRAYEGSFGTVADIDGRTPTYEAPLDVLAHTAPGKGDAFGGTISSTIRVPRSGRYLLNLDLRWIPAETDPKRPNGAGELTIDGKPVLAISGKAGGTASAMVDLDTGAHTLVLAYVKKFGLWYARSNDILLAVEGPGVPYTLLNPVMRAEDPVGQIVLLAKDEPVMQRGFVMHRGHKHTHTISVGEPGGTSYTVDLQKGELLQVWRGDFLETTPMWYGRGETQLSVPLGSVVELAGKPSLAWLTDKNTAWPDSSTAYVNEGYTIDKSGRPVFRYTLGPARVRESLMADATGEKLTHSFAVLPTTAGSVGDPAPGELWCRAAEGRDIVLLPNGLYAVNDKDYFVELPRGLAPLLRTTANNRKELLLPLKSGSVAYAIVW